MLIFKGLFTLMILIRAIYIHICDRIATTTDFAMFDQAICIKSIIEGLLNAQTASSKWVRVWEKAKGRTNNQFVRQISPRRPLKATPQGRVCRVRDLARRRQPKCAKFCSRNTIADHARAETTLFVGRVSTAVCRLFLRWCARGRETKRLKLPNGNSCC